MTEGIGWGRKRLIHKIVTSHWSVKTPEEKTFSYNELLFILQELLVEEGKPYLESGPSLRGFDVFKDFVKHLMYRNLANFDSMILLTADKGMGKSSAAIMIAREWCRLIGIKFNPRRHIAYNNADVMNKIEALGKFEPLIADEAVRFATAADWAKRENKSLKIKLAQVRTKHLLYILCFPLKIAKVDKVYLESFTNYWIDIFGRGLGAIYVKDKNPIQDSWRMKEFEKIGSYTEFTNITQVREKLKLHPNFWQLVKFPRPPDWLYSKYLRVREQNVYDDEDILKNIAKTDIHNALLVLSLRDIMMHDTTLSMNRILLHIRNEYDINLTRSMIQGAIDDATQLITKVKEQAIEP
jgi:hypothetical protein